MKRKAAPIIKLTAIPNSAPSSRPPSSPSRSPTTPQTSQTPLSSPSPEQLRQSPHTENPRDEEDVEPNSLGPLPTPPDPLSTNPDALALEAATHLLSQQLLRAHADLQTLQRIRTRALEDPEAYAQALVKGQIGQRGAVPTRPHPSTSQSVTSTRNGSEGSIGKRRKIVPRSPLEEVLTNGDAKSQRARDQPGEEAVYEPLPTPQNITRCPVIEWSKYHIVGEGLERLHRQEVLDPTVSASASAAMLASGEGHLVAGSASSRFGQRGVGLAPFDPWMDVVE